ncbi:30S ribosomal protein 3, chloroplastic isoform X1 [Phoenix dactylifera]|uniref:30S ribosomal protein 3, chloroplastic n=1 Tax=Phoenix dactylifera TaxID=42345 RepID=A0A8B7BJM2_PHODC|nr:30S ribosomal protein 3, chloroplastic isoform X1 [Phoenix dactylifera]
MLSVSIQGSNLSPLNPQSTFPPTSHQILSPTTKPFFFFSKPNPIPLILASSCPHITSTLFKRLTPLRQSASAAAAEALETSSDADQPEPVKEEVQVEQKEKLGVVVKAMEKPKLVLKFIWMEKNIGLALDQVIPGHGSVPLSPYYFWPRKDAWEELKSKLEEKPWISQKRMIILLNQATDIINLWQQSGGNLQ